MPPPDNVHVRSEAVCVGKFDPALARSTVVVRPHLVADLARRTTRQLVIKRGRPGDVQRVDGACAGLACVGGRCAWRAVECWPAQVQLRAAPFSPPSSSAGAGRLEASCQLQVALTCKGLHHPSLAHFYAMQALLLRAVGSGARGSMGCEKPAAMVGNSSNRASQHRCEAAGRASKMQRGWHASTLLSLACTCGTPVTLMRAACQHSATHAGRNSSAAVGSCTAHAHACSLRSHLPGKGGHRQLRYAVARPALQLRNLLVGCEPRQQRLCPLLHRQRGVLPGVAHGGGRRARGRACIALQTRRGSGTLAWLMRS